MRWAGWAIVVVMALGAAILSAKRLWDSASLNGYPIGPRVDVRSFSRTDHGPYLQEQFALDVEGHDAIPVLAALPAGGGPHPAIVFLYGMGMKNAFNAEVADFFTRYGFALFTPEQYMRGERRIKASHLLAEALALRRRAFLIGVEARHLVDVLERRPDIDPKRIYFWGASFGAIAGCTALADDERFKAGILTLAGGDLPRLIEITRLLDGAGPWARRGARLAAWGLAPLDPVRHVGRVAPRPVLFQNVRDDGVIPAVCSEALHAAAREPKEIIWYDGSHENVERAVVENAFRDGLQWLHRQGASSVSRRGAP